jgi:hypothetical protein
MRRNEIGAMRVSMKYIPFPPHCRVRINDPDSSYHGMEGSVFHALIYPPWNADWVDVNLDDVEETEVRFTSPQVQRLWVTKPLGAAIRKFHNDRQQILNPGWVEYEDTENDEGRPIYWVSFRAPITDASRDPYDGYPKEMGIYPVALMSFLESIEKALVHQFNLKTYPEVNDFPFMSDVEISDDNRYATVSFEIMKEVEYKDGTPDSA